VRRNDLFFYLPTAGPPADRRIAVKGAVRGAMAGGATVTVEGEVIPRLSATLYHRPALNTRIAKLDGAMNRQWQDELNETGSASMVIPNEDPQSTVVREGDVIRYEDQGYACFAWIVREIERQQIARGEEADQVTNFTGNGLLSILSEAVVYPSNGVAATPVEEDRYFSWQSNPYDDSDWSYAKLYAPYWPGENDSPPGMPPNSGMFAGCTVWPLPGTWRITTNLGDYWLAPGGWCYFRKAIYIPPDPANEVRTLLVYALADDESKWWFDSQEMYQTFGWENSDADLIRFQTDVSAGWHVIAVAVHNSELGPMWSEMFEQWINPFSVMAAGFWMDPNTGEMSGEPVFVTDDTWRIVDYPPGPPGWTPGEVIRRALLEAQQRGALGFLSLGFTDETDSDGNPWPEVTDISTKVGTDYLTFFREIAETYIDFWMEPASFRLHAWVKGLRGSHLADVTLHAVTDPQNPYSGNLAGLSYKRVD
jgi:hypothetical protein